MSSKFSGILAQARKRQNDDEEIDTVEATDSSPTQAAIEEKIESAEPPVKNEPPTKTTVPKPASKPKATPKSKLASPQVQPSVVEAPVVEEATRRGRPQGKRSDPNYTQITAYITKETHKRVKLALLEQGDGQEISEVIEECLRDWISKRK